MIGIQGQAGSYHEKVTKLMYSDAKIKYTDTFAQVFDDLLTGKTDKAVIAVANNRYGFITESYSEIIDHYQDIYITDEYYLPIKHQLVGIKGTKTSDIKEVFSQAAAIGQCHKYIENSLNHVAITEYIDTAASAKLVLKSKNKSIVAIASSEAADIYGLEIIAKDIQDDPDNMTRFVAIERKQDGHKDSSGNKITAILKTAQKPGSLADTLVAFKNQSISISSLHSSFIPNTGFEMQFFIEFDAVSSNTELASILAEIESTNAKLTIIGSYQAQDWQASLKN